MITSEFWVEFMQEIFLLVSQNLLAQKIYLNQTYRMSDEDFKTFAINLEEEIYTNIKHQFNQQLPNFPNTQIDNFKKIFGMLMVYLKYGTNELLPK